MKLAVLLFILAATSLFAADAIASPSKLSRKVQRIERACKLPAETITAVGDEIQFSPSSNENYEHVACALAKLAEGQVEKIGFIGNEADPDGMLKEPQRYIAEGTTTQIADLSAAVRAGGWIIIKSAKADDGTMFLIFQTRQGETFGGADRLMQRIWRKEFGELGFGSAPEPLAETTTGADH